jgi:hypothetical protein
MSAPPDRKPPSPVDEVRAMARQNFRPSLSRTTPAPHDRQPPGKRLRLWRLAVLALVPVACAAWIVTGYRVREAPPVAASQDPVADEGALLAASGPGMQVYRLKPAPDIRVLLFSSLTLQGETLNRIGAFVEKAGLPRDRVVDDRELATAIAKGHDSVETYYYGHDYRAADLARFFATAGADHTVLRPEEVALRQVLQREGLLAPGAVGAIISLPPPGNDGIRDTQGRAAILRHEISHGVYFTEPAYAAYVRRFWDTGMTEAEREKFRRFLGGEGYDTGNDDLMRNETQAYLVFTPDKRFFSAAAVDLSDAETAALQRKFLDDMPVAWLRAAAEAPDRGESP